MKNIGYLLKRDIRRILSSWIAVIVILGISVLPSLYAWFNIAANLDPYANTSSIRIAVACADEGIDEKLIGNINVGETIVEELGRNKTLDWNFMTEDEAIDGVKAGEYYAAIIIPKGFSKNLTGFLHGKVDKPVIDYYVNEKLNAIAPKVTDTGSEVLQETIDTKFKETVSIAIIETLGDAAGELTGTLSAEQSDLIDSIDETRAAISKYQSVISNFHSTYGKSKSLSSDADSLTSAISKTLKSLNKVIHDNEKMIDAVKADDEKAIAEIKKFQADYPDIAHPITDDVLKTLGKVDESLISSDEALNKTGGLIAAINPAVSQVSSMMDNLSDGLKDVDVALSNMKGALSATDNLLNDARISVSSLESAEAIRELRDVSGMDYNAMAEFLASPINLDTEKLFPVENYGSGVAPFFTMLAIWVGGLVLIAIFKLEVELDEEEKKRHVTMTEAYFARSILFTIVGLVQAAIVCLGDIYLIGIQCVNPLAFVFAGLIASIVFVNLIYALTITFRHVGKALAVLLVILQIPGSSGTYPVELTGTFFRKLYPVLPFSYGVSALREAIAGFYKSYYWIGVGKLMIFLLVALFLGLVIRPWISSMNHTVDMRLNSTGILSGEQDSQIRDSRALKMAVRMAYSSEEYKEEFEKRVKNVKAFHKKVEDKGFKYIFIIPLALLLLVFVVPVKPLMITIWVICIIAVALFLIIVEHTHVMIRERKYVEEVIADEERNSDI